MIDLFITQKIYDNNGNLINEMEKKYSTKMNLHLEVIVKIVNS